MRINYVDYLWSHLLSKGERIDAVAVNEKHQHDARCKMVCMNVRSTTS